VTHTSHEMQGEVVNELHSEWLSRMSYFHGVDKTTGRKWQVDNEFKLEIALTMKIEMVAPMERIFKEDSPIDKLFVIQRGLVGCRGRVLHEGDAFGDDVLIHYSPVRTKRAAGVVDPVLKALTNQALSAILSSRPGDNEAIRLMTHSPPQIYQCSVAHLHHVISRYGRRGESAPPRRNNVNY